MAESSPTLGTLMPRAEAIHPIKLNDVDPQAWLALVLAKLPDHPAKKIDKLLPWNWKATQAAAKKHQPPPRPAVEIIRAYVAQFEDRVTVGELAAIRRHRDHRLVDLCRRHGP
jgi:hypothetical protein